MSDLLSKFAAEFVTLIGGAITTAVGYAVWRRQKRYDASQPFSEERRAAYKSLWEKAESIHLRIRQEGISWTDFGASVAELNTLFLQRSLYVDDRDRGLANDYLQALFKARALLPDDDAGKRAEDRMAETAAETPVADEDRRRLAASTKSWNAAEKVRKRLRRRVQKVIGL